MKTFNLRALICSKISIVCLLGSVMSPFPALSFEISPLESFCSLKGSITSIFSRENQTVLPGQPILFEETQFWSRDCDLSNVEKAGEILIQKSGIYRVSWRIECQVNIQTTYSLGLLRDDQIVWNSVVSLFSNGAQSLQPISGVCFVFLTEGTVLQLVNISNEPIQLISQWQESSFASAVLFADLLADL